MIGFEYENLRRICGHCCRINHQTCQCPYLPSPIIPLDDSEIQVVPDWNEGASSNNISHGVNRRIFRSSTTSSLQPISQPPSPITPLMNPFHHQDIMGSATLSKSLTISGIKNKAKYDVGECSKRRKNKRMHMRPSRQNHKHGKTRGLKFYTVSEDPQ